MITDEIVFQIRQEFGFEPTEEQKEALRMFALFITDSNVDTAMIMRGSAGTGKTSLAGAVVRTMKKLNRNVTLLAPTGRAAKVFSLNSGNSASTIHRKIYRQKTFTGDMSGFCLGDNLHRNMLFMIDEASMIANDMGEFGSGRLLDDIVQYVYNGHNCRMLLIGDKAQLPPVGEESSPALNADVLRGYGLNVYECDLNEVLRQSRKSGILFNATAIRNMITHDEITGMPDITLRGFADIHIVRGDELIESITSSYAKAGMDETIIVTRSNKRANIYNQGIRNSILGREDELTVGDMLMIVRNNYYWIDSGKQEEAAQQENDNDEKNLPTFIANGDRAKILRVRNMRELYGFHFADVWLQFPDYDNYEIEASIITDSLRSEAPALTREQSETLFNNVMEDYSDIPQKAERIKKIKTDKHYNALQIKYAYAVTCHKAQGGQWEHVYIDQGYLPADMLNTDYIHWLYTAFTRATKQLFLVNWKSENVKV